MAGFYGADVEQLDTLAVALEREGRALEDLLRRLDSRLQSVPWKGPDAERSRSEWTSSLFPRCLQAADGLVSAASVVRRNASDQRDTSGGASSFRPSTTFPFPIPGLPSLPVYPQLPGFFDPGFEFPELPGDHRFLPGDLRMMPEAILPDGGGWDSRPWLAPADVFAPTRDALESNIPGLPWTWGQIGGLTPVVGEVLAVRDMADQMSQGQVPIHGMVDTAAGALRAAPPTYLAGVAVGTWNTAFEEFGKADFSAATRANTADYIASDPWGAVGAAGEAVVSFVPDLIKNFL